MYGGGDLNFSRIVPGTIKLILSDENPIIRSDGTPVRDYLYIDDGVNAYMVLAEKLSKVKGEAFNFGTNSPTSVLDFVNKMIEISGKANIKPVILGKASSEIDKQYLSSEKAKKLLDWEAKVSLDEGLKRTFEWYRNYFSKLKTK
jgi:CDP-glucose 4,6-dehydratase